MLSDHPVSSSMYSVHTRVQDMQSPLCPTPGYPQLAHIIFTLTPSLVLKLSKSIVVSPATSEPDSAHPTMGSSDGGEEARPEACSESPGDSSFVGQDPAEHMPPPLTPAVEDVKFDQAEPDV